MAGAFGARGGGYLMSNSGAWRLDAEAAIAEPEPATRTINQSQLGRALLEADPPLRALFVYNCNPLCTAPDQERLRRGLLREDLFTIVHEQTLTDTARYADLLLPATAFVEHGELARGYGALSMHRWSAVATPPGEAWSNVALFEALLDRLGLSRPDDPRGEDGLSRALLAGAPPALRDALDQDGQADPPVGPTPIQFIDVLPATPSGRIELCPPHLDAEAPGGLYHYQPDPGDAAHPYALISPALEELTSSTFGQLRTQPAELTIHPADAARHGVTTGAAVRLFNAQGEVRVLARVSDEVAPGTLSLPKGLWARHTLNGATSNALIPDTLSDLAGGACYNDARVGVELG